MIVENKNLELLVGIAMSLKKARILANKVNLEDDNNAIKCDKNKLIKEIKDLEDYLENIIDGQF